MQGGRSHVHLKYPQSLAQCLAGTSRNPYQMLINSTRMVEFQKHRKWMTLGSCCSWLQETPPPTSKPSERDSLHWTQNPPHPPQEGSLCAAGSFLPHRLLPEYFHLTKSRSVRRNLSWPAHSERSKWPEVENISSCPSPPPSLRLPSPHRLVSCLRPLSCRSILPGKSMLGSSLNAQKKGLSLFPSVTLSSGWRKPTVQRTSTRPHTPLPVTLGISLYLSEPVSSP